MTPLAPKLSCLPTEQRELWPALADVPRRFVLYGGTALALRLGHRQSADFGFFSSEPFSPGSLGQEIPWLQTAEALQSSPNTLSVLTHGSRRVRLAFFGSKLQAPSFKFQRSSKDQAPTPTPSGAKGSPGAWVLGLGVCLGLGV